MVKAAAVGAILALYQTAGVMDFHALPTVTAESLRAPCTVIAGAIAFDSAKGYAFCQRAL